MKKLVALVGAVILAVLATATLSGNAGVENSQGVQVVSLQKQVNELRSELICLEAVAGDAYEQNWHSTQSANPNAKVQTPIDDRGVCRKLGIKQQIDTSTSSVFPHPFTELIARAFGR